MKAKKFLKNMKTVERKKVAEKSLNQRLRAKKLLKNMKTWINFLKMLTKKCDLAVEKIVNLKKKVTFLILNCVESMLDLNRSFNRSRWVFFSKVYIIQILRLRKYPFLLSTAGFKILGNISVFIKRFYWLFCGCWCLKIFQEFFALNRWV